MRAGLAGGGAPNEKRAGLAGDGAPNETPDSPASWRRLALCLALSTLGGVSLWSSVVLLPDIQAGFGVDRSAASLVYSATMLGAALGSVLYGRAADRFGIRRPAAFASVMLAAGYTLASLAPTLPLFTLAHFLLIALLGGALSFGPLVAHVSLWFDRRRGLAVALCASGNYLAGVFWPPTLQAAAAAFGWRTAHLGTGLLLLAAMLPLALALRGTPPALGAPERPAAGVARHGLATQVLLTVAGLACCLAMATPQVHIVAYCADLGYGAARGAEMLSLMLAFGIVSRVGSGWLADRIGGLRTLLLGSLLQGTTLFLYTQFAGLPALYAISAAFGLVQGGIVPSYAVIVRELFPAREAGARFGLVLAATLLGMSAGGWLAGALDDWTGSYRAAFAGGVLWNAVNLAIVVYLITASTRRRGLPAPAPAR